MRSFESGCVCCDDDHNHCYYCSLREPVEVIRCDFCGEVIDGDGYDLDGVELHEDCVFPYLLETKQLTKID